MAGGGPQWHRVRMALGRQRHRASWLTEAAPKRPLPGGEELGRSRVSSVTACAHDGFHTIRTSYDRRSGVLVYFWACEHCGARLGDARRERYRPAYDPHGYERFLTSQAA